LEDVFDEQEDQARAYRGAATELREAQRLEEAYADLSARGVAGAERVKEAAAQHRAKADELSAKARAFDEQGVPTSQAPTDDGSDAGTGQAAVAAATAGDDIDIDIEIPSVDATAGSATMADDVAVDDTATTTMSTDSSTIADDVDIEMPSTDFGTDVPAAADVDIEMPAMDFGSESSVAGDVAQFDPAADVSDESFEA
jgi:hypothetical protein